MCIDERSCYFFFIALPPPRTLTHSRARLFLLAFFVMVDYWITYIRFAGYNLKCHVGRQYGGKRDAGEVVKNAGLHYSRIVDVVDAFFSRFHD